MAVIGSAMKRSIWLYVLIVVFLAWHGLVLIILPPSYHQKTPPIRSDHPLYPSNLTLLNLTDFRFVLNSPCEIAHYPPWEMVVIVTSNARDFEARSAQRGAYSTSLLRSLRILRVFLLAQDEDVDQEQINEEQLQFQDIVQGNFVENYRNLSYKHVMGLQWAHTFCPNSRYVLKMDDDIMVDIFQLLHKLQDRYPDLEGKMLGYKQMSLEPQRDPHSKWFVSYYEFPGGTYPDFLSGWAYVTTPQTASLLVKESERLTFNWIDDLWVSGFLAPAARVTLLSFNSYFTVHVGHAQCCLEQPEFVCDFMVAPSMDRWKLIRDFGHLSTHCDRQSCPRRSWEKAVIQTCVNAENPLHAPGARGIGEAFVVPNKLR